MVDLTSLYSIAGIADYLSDPSLDSFSFMTGWGFSLPSVPGVYSGHFYGLTWSSSDTE